MYICYDGVTMTMLTLEEFSTSVVMDDAKCDKLYDRVFVRGSFVINGQAEPRVLGDPPVSYTAVSGSTPSVARHTEAALHRPPGQAMPATPTPPDTTLNPQRDLGAGRQFFDVAFPYGATFAPAFQPPSFSGEKGVVFSLTPAPNAPPLTLSLIRKKLLSPRGQLFVFSGTGANPSELMLQSPGWGRVCDARNGPVPSYLNVVECHGDAGTFICEWACETFVNERDVTNPRDPLLSNRYSMQHHVADDSFLTITVQGRAIFDTGILHSRAINPDAYRPQLFLPINKGFVRGDITVTGVPGMDAVDWSYVDRQLPISMPAAPYAYASKISAEHRQAINCDTEMGKSFIGTWDGILNRRWLRMQKEEDARRAKEMHDSHLALNAAQTAAANRSFRRRRKP